MNCCRCLPVVGKGLVGSLATGGRFGVHDGGGEPRHGMDELVGDAVGVLDGECGFEGDGEFGA
jgi:hypothetical protein